MEDSFVSVNYFHNCMACNEVSKFLCFFLSFPFWQRIAYRKGIQDVGDFVSSVEHKLRFLIPLNRCSLSVI